MEEWAAKYAPKTLDDLILEDDKLKTFKAYLEKGTFPSCTLYGHQGIGKTSLAKIVVNSIEDSNELFLNASSENGIDVVRTKITDYIDSVGWGSIKFVILDEVNRFTVDAQESLREPIQRCMDDTRFILTTNSMSKLIGPILSRCPPIMLQPPLKKIFQRLLWILDQEEIEVAPEQKKEILEKIIQFHYPDIRAMVKHLEMCCIEGSFDLVKFVSEDKLDEMVDHILSNRANIIRCREHWIKNEVTFNKDYQMLAQRMFNRIDSTYGMAVIAEHLFRMAHIGIDKEIQFTSMMIALNEGSE